MNTYNSGQIASLVRTLGKMDVDYLGPDSTTQDQAIYQFMNISLWKLARLAYNVEYSDNLIVSADGFVAFQKGNASIANLFEPLQMLKVVSSVDTEDNTTQKRTSYTASPGWWVDSPNLQIHLKGMSGTYRLKYIRYPRQVTQASDPVDMPESGYHALIHEILSLVKTVKNYYSESEAMSKVAKEGFGGITQAAISARGPSTGGQPPSYQDSTIAKGG